MRSTPICKALSCFLALALSVLCPSASLIGLDGVPITLDEFNAEDYVDVKGFPLDGDALRICQMAQAAP